VCLCRIDGFHVRLTDTLAKLQAGSHANRDAARQLPPNDAVGRSDLQLT